MRRIVIIRFGLALILFLSSGILQAVAQDKNKSGDEEIVKESDLDAIFGVGSSGKLSFDMPTLELRYSALHPSHKEIPKDFIAPIGFAEARLGTSHNIQKTNDLSYAHESSNYIYFGGGATSLAIGNGGSGAKSSLWRFGLGDRESRGWKFGGSSLLLFYGSSAAWSEISFSDSNALNQNPKLYDFNDAFRYGKITEGGIGFKIGNNFAMTAGYEQTVVLPRFMTLYWITGEIIETLAHGAAEAFIKRIEKSSPSAAPVISFLLHNGIGFGLGQLKKEKMNWPFNTAPALLQNGFQLGASFRF